METMTKSTTDLQDRIQSGAPLLLAEISPPTGADPAAIQELAKRYAGKVHALGINDNRDRVSMSAIAAASLVAAEGIEPILHVNARDRNRIALVSEALGARALGIRNILCTSGSHQTLGLFRAAKNVFDIDAVQMLQTFANLTSDGSLVGEDGIAGADGFCLGAVASQDADPLELQVMRLQKKVEAGARFLITQPVYDLERFNAWWTQITRQGTHEKAAFVAEIEPLVGQRLAHVQSGKRPVPRVPAEVLQRFAGSDQAAQKRAAVELAVETIKRLSQVKGLRGFSIAVDRDHDMAMEIIEKSGLGSNR